MDRRKKKGLLLMAIGILVPLLALPFVSGYSKERGFWDNFYKIGIQIKKDVHGTAGNEPLAQVETDHPNQSRWTLLIPKRIPFRFFLVVTLIFFYMGIVRLAPPRKEQDND